MHLAAHAVPNKFAHNRKIISTSFVLDFGADIAHAPAFMGDADCARERVFGRTQHLLRAPFNDSTGTSRGLLTNPPTRKKPYAELHHVAYLNPPLPAITVAHCVVRRHPKIH